MSEYQILEKCKLFDDGVCPICYSAPQVDQTIPPCGHVFCYQCLKDWSNKSKYRATCPVCSSAFSEIVHSNRKEAISPTLIQYAAQVQYCCQRFISYMDGVPFLFFCWIIMLIVIRGLHATDAGILLIFLKIFIYTGIFCSVLEIRYVLIYGFLPRNLVAFISLLNSIGFIVTVLCFCISLL